MALPVGKDIAIKNESDPFELDDKRFYLPASITAKCPHCGKEVEHSFDDDYLSYPTANEPFNHFNHVMYCGGEDGSADHEFRVRVRLTVKLEEVVG